MEVLGFQIFFFLLILFVALFGRKARNIVVIGSILFTVIMVFTNWLIILQLVTIFIAYIITENYVEKSVENLQNIDKKYGQGCLIFIVIGGVIAILLKLYSDDYKERRETQIRDAEIEDSIKVANDSINSLYRDTLNLYSSHQNYDVPLNNDSIELNKNVDEIYDDEIIKKEIIHNFISAENNRDFYSMNEYLSNSMEKFWNIDYPSNQQVAQKYYSTWSNYNYTNTKILEIIRITANFYLIKVEYEYDGKKKINEISFLFDDNNKISIIE